MIHQCIDISLPEKKLDSAAKLYTYVIENSSSMEKDKVRPAVILCPGGGYSMTSDREAEPVALQLISYGFHAFVLRYHVAPVQYPIALLELAQSVKEIREHAKEWHVDTEHIIAAGFSAGGHLAASLAVFWTKEWIAEELKTTKEMIQPNGCLLSYPVITSSEYAHRDSFVQLLGSRYNELLEEVSLEKQVNEFVPPVFLWHTYTDDVVPVENSLLFLAALRKYQISAEFHMYPVGGHGLSLATEETRTCFGEGVQLECASWINLAVTWLKQITKKSEK